MRKSIFIWTFVLILLSSLSASSQTVSKDTSQSAEQILKQKAQIDSLRMEFEKVKKEGYEKAIEGANRSIFISTFVVVFVALLISVIGILGFLIIREIKKDYMETKEELKRYKEEIGKICEDIKEKRKFAEREVQEIESFKKNIYDQQKEVPLDFSKEVSELRKKDSKTAIQEYEKVMNKIFDEEIYSTMAYNYYVEGRYEDSIVELKKVIRLSPQSYDDYYNWGAVLQKAGRHEEAIEKYRKATELKPDYASGWYNIACFHSLQKNKEGALKNLKKAIELDPTFKEKAKKDEDFKNLWKDDDFKKLVE